MNDPTRQLSRSHDIAAKVARLFQTRAKLAQERFSERVQKAYEEQVAALTAKPMSPWDIWTSGAHYAVDFAQRSVLFWDTLRQRGNNFVERTRQGLPPVLHFDYEMVLDGRTLERPVNYALVRIVPPEGVTVDAEAASLRHHRSARRPRPRHRRLQGRFAGRRGAARRPPGLLRDLLPRARAGADHAGRLRGRAAVRAAGCASCIPRRPSPPSSATARAAGRP